MQTAARPAELTAVLEAHKALCAELPDGETKRFFDRCHAALETEGKPRPEHQGAQPAVCDHIPEALRVTAEGSPGLARLADAFGALAPMLNWKPTDRDQPDDPRFPDNHANATLIGNDGVEYHDNVRLGVSLIAPGYTYPRHNHPPEEGYLVMSGGDWRQNDTAWFRREPGETVHNIPNIWHAMRAGDDAPLLALWMLWMRD
jgi:quercetin dioxygenase-like cupin family protein